MNSPNLNYLEKQWLTGKKAEKALFNFKKLNVENLAHVLRHHSESGGKIPDKETWLRDEFDDLLMFYSIVEIGTMIGFVSELPVPFRKRHLSVLNHAAVRRYYEWNYPQGLPRRLRERMQSGVAHSMTSNAELNGAFYEFLELTKLVERDRDVGAFLWTLDGGWHSDHGVVCNIENVQKQLGNPAWLAQAVQKPPQKQTRLDSAVVGFCKFIQFCESLDALLESLKRQPEVAEAMWLAHAYWLHQLKTKLGANLNQAIQSLAKWKLKGEDVDSLRLRVNDIQELMQRLAVPPLSNWKMIGEKLADRESSFIGFTEDLFTGHVIHSAFTLSPTGMLVMVNPFLKSKLQNVFIPKSSSFIKKVSQLLKMPEAKGAKITFVKPIKEEQT